MRRYFAVSTALALVLMAAPSSATETLPTAGAAGPNYIFAGGGTQLSNGFFFPGTTICDADGCTVAGPPLEIEKGTDITFVNLDPVAAANSHRIVSVKTKKRTGRPVFYSEDVDGPGQTTLITSHLKKGTYTYYCSTHFGMFGTIEVVPGP